MEWATDRGSSHSDSVIALLLLSEMRAFGVDGTGHIEEVASKVSLVDRFVSGGYGSWQENSTIGLNKSVHSPPLPQSGARRDEEKSGDIFAAL